jgi:GxxExxY protein
MKTGMGLIFEEQTRVVRRCLFDVHNEVSVGYPEEACHRAFVACCRKRGIPMASKQTGRLLHCGRLVHTFQFDVMVWEAILLELKALPGGLAQENYFQIISYLKFWKKSLGLLVNFGQERVKAERVPFATKPYMFSEDYEHIKPLLSKELRAVLQSTRAGILEVARLHGLGYGGLVCGKLLAVEWQHRALTVRGGLFSPVQFEEDKLGPFPVDALLVGEQVLCCVSALKDEIGPYELGKAQAYVRALNLPMGLAVNFGKRALQIRGVKPPAR